MAFLPLDIAQKNFTYLQKVSNILVAQKST